MLKGVLKWVYDMKDWKDILYESLEDKSIPQWILDIEVTEM